MTPLKLSDVRKYVEENIGPKFHDCRLAAIENLKLGKLLERKNPYLFKAKNVQSAEELVRMLLDAYFSSGEEGMFGDFLEGLAIFVCEKVYNGRKSSTEGLDLEFEKDGIRYFVAIKSGPNWGNSPKLRK